MRESNENTHIHAGIDTHKQRERRVPTIFDIWHNISCAAETSSLTVQAEHSYVTGMVIGSAIVGFSLSSGYTEVI